MAALLRNYVTLASVLLALSRCSSSNSDFHSTKLAEETTNVRLSAASHWLQASANEENPEIFPNYHNSNKLENQRFGNGSIPQEIRNFKTKNRAERSQVQNKMVTYVNKRSAQDGKRRRRFYPYPSQVVRAPPIQSFTYYDTAAYEIQRPYIIPIWGAPNRVPIYFPPQPVYSNPGFPVDNQPYQMKPIRGYLPIPPPRGYLPPSTEMPTGNRFDDRPVWGVVSDGDDNSIGSDIGPQTSTASPPTRRPTPTRRPAPTRRPVANRPTFPSLVHGEESSGNDLAAGSGSNTVPTTPRPRPVTTTQQTRPPSEISGRPSACIWATISCCSGLSADISYSCFEQLGCIGAFWDTSPCDSDFAKAAIAAALNYYN